MNVSHPFQEYEKIFVVWLYYFDGLDFVSSTFVHYNRLSRTYEIRFNSPLDWSSASTHTTIVCGSRFPPNYSDNKWFVTWQKPMTPLIQPPSGHGNLVVLRGYDQIYLNTRCVRNELERDLERKATVKGNRQKRKAKWVWVLRNAAKWSLLQFVVFVHAPFLLNTVIYRMSYQLHTLLTNYFVLDNILLLVRLSDFIQWSYTRHFDWSYQRVTLCFAP